MCDEPPGICGKRHEWGGKGIRGEDVSPWGTISTPGRRGGREIVVRGEDLLPRGWFLLRMGGAIGKIVVHGEDVLP